MVTTPTWIYKGKVITEISDMPENTFGFIYEVTHISTGRKYLGKKQLMSVTNKALGKKELALITDKRLSKKKQVIKESDWKTYYGSSKELAADIKLLGVEKFRREIIYLAKGKKQLTYLELKAQFEYDVLEINSYNDNIAGKFFRKDLI